MLIYLKKRLKLFLIILALAALGTAGYYAYCLYNYEVYKIQIQKDIESNYERDHFDPNNRKPRSIGPRTPEMQQAFSVVSSVLAEAIKRSDTDYKANARLEIRFYSSPDPHKELVDQFHFWGALCDSLQLFQINSDGTVSPLGERKVLPPNIVFYLRECNGLEFDVKKNIMFLNTLYRYSQGTIVFLQTDVSQQTSISDRIIIFFDGRIYEDGGDDVQEQVHWQAQVPGTGYDDSPEVRQ